MPRDRFGREINYLRISVIDHCNLRCVYCMPLRGLSFVPSPELLTAEEIETVARAAVQVGFHKFRLTAAVNRSYAPFDTPLRDGDEVVFVPPVSGG